MKKMMLILFCTCSTLAFAQYKPTQNDLGKDCKTEDNKLGVWREVTVTETYSNSGSQTRSNTSSQSFNASAGANGGVVSGSVGYGNGNSNTNSFSNSSTNSTSRSYNEIQCVEDKTANYPQQTPIRW